MTSVGVIGMGVVGTAVYRGFMPFVTARGYDLDATRSVDWLDDTLQSDVVFLCLPTPAAASGEADLAAIHACMSTVVERLPQPQPLFALKSTVPIGTTTLLRRQYGVRIVHCPEFLSARTAEKDFLTTTRVIIGSHHQDEADVVACLFRERFPGVNVIFTTPEESEFTKYALNSLYATKITFFNELRLLADATGLDWQAVMRGVLSSGWVEQMHTTVPGPDGQYGFGGACFPKDTAALAATYREHGIDCLVLDAVIRQNAIVRSRGAA